MNPPSPVTGTLPNIFRDAQEAEDDDLSRILYNAFLPLWNHNWFQNISSPLPPIAASQTINSLSAPQKARRGFYLSLIKATRLCHGTISVLSGTDCTIHAVLLWLPPHRRMGITKLSALYYSGFLGTILAYGIVGTYRINFVFEANVDAMFAKAGIPAEGYGFVQMLAANPENRGKGSASRLLKWRMRRHNEEYPGVPVVLDTTTTEGVRAYLRLGFEEVGSVAVDTGTDSAGFNLSKDASEEVRRAGRETCVQRVMAYHAV